ncbi:hypothetical protein [Streptomyces sp. AC154]|uniref:hypothetical protein n=1 Tax=Streptomyces sp. AC154 TaxID=3143184 RepID=UPI003F8071F0
MIRLLFEDIALSPLDPPLTEANRFALLHDLDRLPVGARTEWGHLLADMLRDVPEVPEEHCKWRFRRMLHEDDTRQLIFGAATLLDSRVKAAFQAYVLLRHHEVTTRTDWLSRPPRSVSCSPLAAAGTHRGAPPASASKATWTSPTTNFSSTGRHGTAPPKTAPPSRADRLTGPPYR